MLRVFELADGATAMAEFFTPTGESRARATARRRGARVEIAWQGAAPAEWSARIGSGPIVAAAPGATMLALSVS